MLGLVFCSASAELARVTSSRVSRRFFIFT
jgi:hypothetical protein